MQSAATVILTGASGFIGQHLIRSLESGNPTSLFFLDIRKLNENNLGELCVRAADGSLSKLSSLRHCTLVHLAWCPPTRDDLQPHALQVKLLSELLGAHGSSIDRVIAIGSAEEYGHRSGYLREDEAVNSALSAYGWGKRSVQTLLETWCGISRKPGLWLRPFLVYGEGQQGNMAIPYAVRQALRREIAEFSAGTQQRDFIHVADVAEAIRLAIAAPWTGFNVANLGTGVGTCLRDVLEQIGILYGAVDSFHYGARPMRAGEPEVQVARTESATNLFGFSSQIILDQGLLRMHKAMQ